MSEYTREELTERVRAMQIIVFALAMGVVTFGVVVALVIQPKQTEEVFLAYVGAAAGAIAIPAALVVPRIFASQQPITPQTYQAKIIIGAAILEGTAFLNLTAYMIEGHLYSLAVAGVLLLLILMHFPTVGGVEDWLTARKRREQENEAFTR